MSYAAKLVMHAKLAKGGWMYVKELVDFPGITIVDTKQKRDTVATRKIIFGDEEFDHIADAITVWQMTNGGGS